ncbi:MAG TPA: VWA domain-containing protein [Chloroflexota bacterium]|nr:VWA domain-containing protein [Chloroflexota bacterium]
MSLYRYRRWDGTQQIDPFTAEDAMDFIADHVLDEGDLRSALRRMLQRGAESPTGRRMEGLQDLLKRLRQARQRQQQRYNLGSALGDIKERLERIVGTERSAIEDRLKPSPTPPSPAAAGEGTTPELQKMLENLSKRRLQQLDQLPPDAAGQVQQLREYDFLSPDARQQFEDLLKELQEQILQQYFRGFQQGLQSLTPEGLKDIRDMLRDLNRLLEGKGSFDDFMRKWGKNFPPGMESPEQLADYLQKQMAAMESLLNSMTPEMRKELEDLMANIFQDAEMQSELTRLAANMHRMFPGEGGDEFDFGGDEPVTLQEAMRLMGDMHGLDELEQELLQAIKTNDVSDIDTDEIGRLVGEEARGLADQLQQLTKMLEEAGLIQRKGKDWELTPRATRKIGERALQDIFGRIDGSLLGNHDLIRRGYGAERLDETKRYTFGDPFELDANRTLMNGLFREAAAGGPSSNGRLHLTTDDFEIYRTTAVTRCSTVIMLDMSYSMMMAGRFEAGRRVALALDSLIRNKFPRDWLRVVAFSYFVLTLEPRMLLDSYWVEYGGGTNFQEALRQARVLLERQKGGTRQIVMITDGEPNTYSYWSGGGNGRAAMAETLREVTRCTREGIVINTFMMAQEPSSTHFVRLMAKLNHGRAFFSSPRHLGAYVLLDYVSNKRRAVS